MDVNEVKEKADEALNAGKEKSDGAFIQVDIEAGKKKLKAGATEIKKRISLLPFRNMLEKKVPSATREKFPVLNKLIPLTNFIIVALVALLVFAIIPKGGRSGGGGSLANTTWEGIYTSMLGQISTSFSFDKTTVRETYRPLSDDFSILMLGSGSKEGTYNVSGNTVTINWVDGKVSEGTKVGNSLSIDGKSLTKR